MMTVYRLEIVLALSAEASDGCVAGGKCLSSSEAAFVPKVL